jgi:hypothetical protein
MGLARVHSRRGRSHERRRAAKYDADRALFRCSRRRIDRSGRAQTFAALNRFLRYDPVNSVLSNEMFSFSIQKIILDLKYSGIGDLLN